ncbi:MULTISPECIES: hypothetical protein [unclassified Microbacterium]|uniref:hypothetical protein n=1 Tax=unclassified Microbacterium TaxID=2609290 RepID=UPI000AF70513|nr:MULTISPECIES: hypothetical protein [unclassified Microbacterium]MBN9178125.1 hypothetical protein [Microbacterium sp.]PZT86210.1 MAG: hypothetical protein DI630_35315 [Gordonia sp. (in: high G+C Gram-positive bacteria)]
MVTDELANLLQRAYGPDQEPLTQVELYQLRGLQTFPQDGRGIDQIEDVPRTRASRRWGWPVAVVVIGVVAGFTGHAYGEGGFDPAAPAQTDNEQVSGIPLPDGRWGSLSDADCAVNLSATSGARESVTCTWSEHGGDTRR